MEDWEAAAHRRRSEAPSHQPRSGALYSRYSRSSGRADCASPLLCSPNFNSSFVSIHPLLASDQTAPRARHHVREVKAQHRAATPGWECRNQQVRRCRVRGAQRKSRGRHQRRQLEPGNRASAALRAVGGSAPISPGRVLGFVSSGLRVTSPGICSARGYSLPWA